MAQNTFNNPDFPNEDRDALGSILIGAMGFNLEFAEATGEPTSAQQVAKDVAWAAEHVGWHRDPEKATRTFNVENCTCGEDHDGIEHLVKGTLLAYDIGAIQTADQLTRMFERVASETGWVKA
ncbi:hypothetical protein [Rhodococcus phage REQ1]|uniref:hypothetical protein n=1 Tax=Rhodococcus phage REQ1 TaxID=1109712 RepID=UPI00023EEBFC|nr:hypothetical protein RoPhREQ1_gp27 [Rhodococcus phage REQ1]AEV52023.1 hypothetical protein [Rhodococcus phage REQ1]